MLHAPQWEECTDAVRRVNTDGGVRRLARTNARARGAKHLREGGFDAVDMFKHMQHDESVKVAGREGGEAADISGDGRRVVAASRWHMSLGVEKVGTHVLKLATRSDRVDLYHATHTHSTVRTRAPHE